MSTTRREKTSDLSTVIIKIYSVCRMAVLSALPFRTENLLSENAAILMSTIR